MFAINYGKNVQNQREIDTNHTRHADIARIGKIRSEKIYGRSYIYSLFSISFPLGEYQRIYQHKAIYNVHLRGCTQLRNINHDIIQVSSLRTFTGPHEIITSIRK